MGLGAVLIFTCCAYVVWGLVWFGLLFSLVLLRPFQLLCCLHTPFLDVLVPTACVDVSTTTTPLYLPLIQINLFHHAAHRQVSLFNSRKVIQSLATLQ